MSNAALERTISNLIRLGIIAEVEGAMCRVESGELLTAPLPWLSPTAGDHIAWCPATVGEQVVLLCPDGDLANAIALRGLYSDQFPSPDVNPRSSVQRFPDGAVIAYDSESHALNATLPQGGTVALTADGGLTINGPVTINGDTAVTGAVSITGTAEVSEDVIGGGISLKRHTHGAVQPGGGNSGPPA